MGKKVPRKVDVFFSPAQVDQLSLRGKNVVIIDVLRASTTISMALFNGAKEIIPIAGVESAVKIPGSLFGDVTLRGGERNGKVIEGFNLGNSPGEYTEETVKGKSIIYTTTNGSAAMVKARYAHNLVVGGFINLSKVVGFLKALKDDFVVICAGKQNEFCLEDAVCSGMMLFKLQQSIRSLDVPDAGRASIILFKKFGRNILRMLLESEHGKFLTDIGFEKDLPICASVDSIPVLPIMSGNVIKLTKSVSSGLSQQAVA